MDFSTLDTRSKSNAGQFLHLKHPGTNKPLIDPSNGEPVGLFLLGRDSDKYTEIKHARNNSAIKSGSQEDRTSEVIEQESRDLIAQMTTGWRNIKINGDDEFSYDSVLQLYKQWPWTYEQANEFGGDRSNFI